MWKKLYRWFNRHSEAALLKAYTQQSSLEGFGLVELEQTRSLRMNDLEFQFDLSKNHCHIHTHYSASKEGNAFVPSPSTGLILPAQDRLYLYPGLSDRPMLLNFKESIVIPPSSEITIEVLSPLWVRVGSDDRFISLLELPSEPMKSAWLGKLPEEGKMAYSLPEDSMALNSIATKRFHAKTQVVFENQRRSPISLSAQILPMPYLSLYLDSEGIHHTSSLRWIFTNAMDPKLIIESFKPEQGFSMVQDAQMNPSALMMSDFIQLASQV